MALEVNFACGTCGNGLVLPLGDRAGAACARCGGLARLAAPATGVAPLERCAACAVPALFVQRDFNRILGLAIVGVSALFAVKTRGLSLLAAALVDGVLYRTLPRITVCYACDAVHRGVPVHPEHGAYDHHVEDGYKEEKSKRQVAAQAWRHAHPA
jgi:hypothetical protein